jgi:hypothetical protein
MIQHAPGSHSGVLGQSGRLNRLWRSAELSLYRVYSRKISDGGCLIAASHLESPYNEDKTSCKSTCGTTSLDSN